MAVLEKPVVNPKAEALLISPEAMEDLRAMAARQFEEYGIEYDPSMTPEKLHAMMRSAGIRPEENFLSRGIIAAREE